LAPNFYRDEFEGGEIVFRPLVVPCRDSPELFDPVEEAFDEVPLPIDPPGESEAALAVGLRRDVCPSLPLGGLGANDVTVVALVGQQDVAFAKTIDQGFGLGAIGDLTGSQAEGDGPPFGVDERVDLAGEAAAGTSHATIVSIPLFPVAACWWTRTQVLSIMTMSLS